MEKSDPASEKPGALLNVWREAKRMWKKLLEIEGSPRAIAGGIAVGVFYGVTPLWGVKTLMTLGTATVLRVNPLAAVIALTAHDVLTPFVPVILRLQYDLGYYLLSHPHHLPPSLGMSSLNPEAFFHWTTFFHAGLPLLIGSLVMAFPATVASYFFALWFFTSRQKQAKTS